MRATISQLTKSGKTKTITGQVLQRGFGKITLAVTNRNGTLSIRQFDESKYTVRVFE